MSSFPPSPRLSPAAHAARFTAGLVAVLGTMSTTLEYGARHATSRRAGKIGGVMLHRISTEIAVFGASNAEGGISPDIVRDLTGRSVENLALDGTNILQFGALVREFVSYAPKGTMVVLAVSPFALTRPSLPTRPSLYYPFVANDRIYEAMASFDPTLAWRARYVPLYPFVLYEPAFYKNALDGLVSLYRPREGAARAFFSPTDATWTADPTTPFPVSVDPSVERLYREVIEDAEATGHRVVIAFPSIWAEAPRWLPGLDEVLRAFARMATPSRPFLDYHADPMGLDKANFYNVTHLTKQGGRIFSRMLGRDLARILDEGARG